MSGIYCIYHSADLDGMCSAAIVRKYHSDVNLVPYNYGQPIALEQFKDQQVFMVDVSMPMGHMKKLQQIAQTLVWIDHHRSAIKDAEAASVHPPGIRLEGKAGCELTWQYFYDAASMPRAVYLLGRHDVFDHEADTWVVPFQYAMRGLRHEPDALIWEKLLGPTDDMYLTELVVKGNAIYEYQTIQDEKAVKGGAFETMIETYPTIALNIAGRGSPVFDSVYDEDKHDLMLVFRYTKLKTWSCSIYSYKEHIDCGAIAKRYGGGGHPGAAGFEVKELPFDV